MFGKHFASMYTGSMFGKPALVFAIWGYSISMMRPDRKEGECFVELNAALLAATFASSIDDVVAAIDELCAPDQNSRSEAEEGRRLTPVGDRPHFGPTLYRVVNGSKYRAMRDEEERRTYLREAKRKERAVNRPVDSQPKSTAVNRRLPPSTKAEAEAEAEATTTYPPPGAVVEGVPKGEGQTHPFLQASDRADAALDAEARKLQNTLGGKIALLAEHPNSRDMVATWCRRVTSYKTRNGEPVKGVADYRLIRSADRLEKSIADADNWLKRLDKGPLKETPHGL